ncbi:DUF3160 domain-containing protein [Pyxidicoccus parkwayensis]|uniref:DUF3160 domain-containing protein n=1 Tax=Pyxidicoccus parkwayensis TaxID=2813578 RepID=A0ABX7NRY4_9BACT|nr:DUF3160 domain-containing protein [Pyxidicoccus parkwaysis]QSQ18923.1 DUF3160 domain-containing protein [Pyxidicoccus parkwaysis]
MRSFRTVLLLAACVLAGCATHLQEVPKSTPELSGPLTPDAARVLRANNVVISTGSTIPSFHLGYSGLFKAHAPMYFTTDSLLHALHSSYDAILSTVENHSLSPELGTLLTGLREGLARNTGGSPEARAELDFLLTVAESLLQGKVAAPVAGARQQEVAAWFNAAAAEGPCDGTRGGSGTPPPRPSAESRLYGPWPLKSIAQLDLSMLRPRGHYAQSPDLCRYFQATMWLGRAELRIARATETGWEVNRLALETVLLLDSLLTERTEEAWRRIDETTRTFVGPADSLSFPGLRRAAQAHGMKSVSTLGQLTDDVLIATLQPEAAQRIASGLRKTQVPGIDFLVLGQRYVFDSEVLSSVSYGALQAKRMMPSALDVGWAALRNPVALALLKPELERYHYRDALDAVARRGDEAGPERWQGSLNHLWLNALRGLSPDSKRDAHLPAVMRSEAWGRRLLNSQLSSWAELRHDTLLYAKHTVTLFALCEYPAAYVDPYPDFYRAVEKLAAQGGALAERLPMGDAEAQKRLVNYFERLGEVSFILREIAEREQQGQEMTAEQLDFMNHAVSFNGKEVGCDGSEHWEPGGWYADLYFNTGEVLTHRAVVADVHTQPTDEAGGAVGKVLHVGTGMPRLMTVTLDTGSGPRTYQGFVSTYLEETTRDFQRLNDEEWEHTLGARQDVPWMRDLIAP